MVADVTAARTTSTSLGRALRVVVLLSFAAFVLLLPSHSDTFGHFAAYAAIFAMVGISMNILVGYTGQISLGQQAFVGVGALTAANVVHTGTNVPDPFTFALGMVAAIAVSAGGALVLGAVALRIRGLYL